MKKRFTLKNLVISIIVLYSTFSFVNQTFKMKRISGDITKQRIELESVQEKNNELQDEVNLTKTDLYAEKQARERLGYVKSGETPVIEGKTN